jgi:nicotinamide-nucleotide amidase
MLDLVEKLGKLLTDRHLMLAVAESCTGGLLSATITHKAGASAFYDRGFITYSNDAKTDILGVPKTLIDMNGAVSAQVAEAMARGALRHSNAHLAIAITGIAGPDGGTEKKPVGTIYFGYALRGGSVGSVHYTFTGTRAEIQSQAALTALKDMIDILEREGQQS